MILNIAKLVGGSVLAGAGEGRQAFMALLESTQHPPERPEIVYLDFGDVEVATASFLRESILAFRDRVRGSRSEFYPIVANANELVTEDLMALMELGADAIMTCELSKNGSASEVGLIGRLDSKQKLTFNLVTESGGTSARDLREKSSESVSQTAWNNRLANLVGLGLVMEVSDGRAKVYRPLLGGC